MCAKFRGLTRKNGVRNSRNTILGVQSEPACMNNAILPRTLAVFAVCSTLVYCYDLGPMFDTKKYYVKEEWNVTKYGHQYHT